MFARLTLRKKLAISFGAVLATAVALIAVAAPAAASAPASSSTALASLESGLLRQLNAIRTDHGLVVLRSSAPLAAAAAGSPATTVPVASCEYIERLRSRSARSRSAPPSTRRPPRET